MTNKRPLLLYMLVLAFLFCTTVSVLGDVQALNSWNWLAVYQAKPTAAYLIFHNTFTALGWLTAAIVLWMRVKWAPQYCTVMSLIASTWFWVNHLVLTQNPYPFSRHLVAIILNIILLFFVLFSLYLLTPYMRGAPGEKILVEDRLADGGQNEKTTP